MSDRPRRPAFRTPWQLDQQVGGSDPADAVELSHTTAQVLVHRGRAADDPEVTRRLVELVDDLGLDALALLWADRPARSLPGVLWRLYALRQWVASRPQEAAREYRDGVLAAEVSHAVAGVVDPPGPQEVHDLVDAVLTRECELLDGLSQAQHDQLEHTLKVLLQHLSVELGHQRPGHVGHRGAGGDS